MPDENHNERSYTDSHWILPSMSKYKFPVITVSLDDFVCEEVSVMKIDVEGFEIRVLKGAERTIAIFGVGALLIEIASNR